MVCDHQTLLCFRLSPLRHMAGGAGTCPSHKVILTIYSHALFRMHKHSWNKPAPLPCALRCEVVAAKHMPSVILPHFKGPNALWQWAEWAPPVSASPWLITSVSSKYSTVCFQCVVRCLSGVQIWHISGVAARQCRVTHMHPHQGGCTSNNGPALHLKIPSYALHYVNRQTTTPWQTECPA